MHKVQCEINDPLIGSPKMQLISLGYHRYRSYMTDRLGKR